MGIRYRVSSDGWDLGHANDRSLCVEVEHGHVYHGHREALFLTVGFIFQHSLWQASLPRQVLLWASPTVVVLQLREAFVVPEQYRLSAPAKFLRGYPVSACSAQVEHTPQG